MDPGTAGALAGVLPPRYRLAAAAAVLSGRTGSVSLPSGRVSSDPAEPDRAGAGHGQPGTPWAEVLQMRLAYPLADRHLLPAVPLGVLACATIPAHVRQPRAPAQVLALRHRDPLQSHVRPCLLTAGSTGTLPASWNIASLHVNHPPAVMSRARSSFGSGCGPVDVHIHSLTQGRPRNPRCAELKPGRT